MRVNNGLTPQELEAYGISDVHDIVYNPSYDLLYQEELDPSLTGYERGVLTNLGAVAVDTGIFTGRSPKDKYIVRDDTTRDTFWWADKGKGKNDNKPLSPETWQHLKGLVTKQLSGKRLFVVDAFCGANPDTRLSVRFITEVAWQAHFVKNMFIRPSDEELAGFRSILRQLITAGEEIATSALSPEAADVPTLLDQAQAKVFAIDEKSNKGKRGFRVMRSIRLLVR